MENGKWEMGPFPLPFPISDFPFPQLRTAMSIGIIGKKLGMTQIFNEQGQQVPVTVIEAEPNPVTKVVDKATAGFAAVELGYGRRRTPRASNPGERTPRGRRAT